MADDIVIRLRQAEWYCNRSEECMGTCDKRHARRNCPDPDTSHEAADKIERLRAELEEAYDACRYALADSPRWQENCATVVATWEATRRG